MTIALRHRTGRLAAGAAVLALTATLSGCWSGFNAQTSDQATQAVGNGANAEVGAVLVRGATWVRSLENLSNATLVATFVTTDGEPDALVKVDVEPPTTTGITGGSLTIPARGSARTGYLSPNFVNVFGLEAWPSAFVPTTFTFEKAGPVSVDVLAVPAAGQYADVVTQLPRQLAVQRLISGAQRVQERRQARGEVLEQAQTPEPDASATGPTAEASPLATAEESPAAE